MKIAFLGDIGFIGNKNLDNNSDNYEYFKEVREQLLNYDYVIGNLETPFTEAKKIYGVKSAHICTSKENVKLLKYLNVNIVTLANNHIYDYGVEGYELTKKILKENQIEYFGIENKEIFIEKEDNKVALLGYCCYSTNPLGVYNKRKETGINIMDPRFIENRMINNDLNGYLNILNLHMGEEHIHYPNYDHVKMVRKLQKKVNYIMIGHHPHVLQGIEKLDKSYFAYSLGNFCFDDVYTDKSKEPLIKQQLKNRESIIIGLEIKNNEIVSDKIIPIFDDGKKIRLNVDNVLKKVEEYNELLYKDEEIFCKEREGAWKKHILSRKSKRNLEWYFKRLNFKSVRMIIEIKRNCNMYKKYIKEYIKEAEN